MHMNDFVGKINGEKNYPGRCSRTVMVSELVNKGGFSQEAVLCGRVIGLLDEGEERAFVFQDASGRLDILCGTFPNIGDIVEVRVEQLKTGKYKAVGDVQVLAPCEEFYVSSKISPNYKKIVVDEYLRNELAKRSQIISEIRRFFGERGFLETETPCLVKYPGMEPYLDVFKTKFESAFSKETSVDQDMFLITSPEYSLKKLLAGGLEKIFQITKTFRNKESFSDRHNPEFTMLEWYRAYASYEEIMDDTEALVKHVWENCGFSKDQGGLVNLVWKGQEIDIMSPWRRLRVIDSFKEFAGVDEDTFFNLGALTELVKSRGYAVGETPTFDDLFFTLFLNEIEPNLGIDKPTVLYDYPVSMAALSKRCARDVRFAERFEVYIGGLELCNGFTELNDPVEQETRLLQEKQERSEMGKDPYDLDAEFIKALKFGMPPSGGNALGIDRLIMLTLGEENIENTMYFPYRDL